MELFDWVQKIAGGLGGVGFFIALIIAWKSGLLSFVSNLKKNGNGNGNGYQKQIDELHEHARVANGEMGEIRKSISAIEKDVSFIKGKLST